MHDLNFIRENPQEFDLALERRNLKPKANEILALDHKIRSFKGELQELQQQKNKIAKEIGVLKSKGEEAQHLFKEADKVKKRIFELENNSEIEYKLNDILLSLPNILANDVEEGESEDDNIELKKFGKIKQFHFTPKQHFELGENLGMMDFEQAAIISGSRFVILKNDLAKLERILATFMLDLLTEEYNLQEIMPPLLVNEKAMIGTGQLPKFAEDAFVTTDGKWLISTAEIALANLVQNKILNEKDLPLRFCAYTPCFRSEAGSAGKDSRGMIRLHQFNKVEMVSITNQQSSNNEHEHMLMIAEEILKRLKLPYRVVKLCSKDTGFGAKKTYDIEVWLPGQNCYREISSASNCGDFQARRMKARYKDEDKNIKFVHSLNASALAVGRTLVALIENYQNEDGSINIPEILQPYFKGQTIIK
ncbi:MAG: serine--tRNA ligase [Alphaproteobacteria bacterium]|nr:serine--tRNA ligase [Alphaproteobacteria bacterium]